MVRVDLITEYVEGIDHPRAEHSRESHSQRLRAVVRSPSGRCQNIIRRKLKRNRRIDTRHEVAREHVVFPIRVVVDSHGNLELVLVQDVSCEHRTAWIAALWKSRCDGYRSRTQRQVQPAVGTDDA